MPVVAHCAANALLRSREMIFAANVSVVRRAVKSPVAPGCIRSSSRMCCWTVLFCMLTKPYNGDTILANSRELPSSARKGIGLRQIKQKKLATCVSRSSEPQLALFTDARAIAFVQDIFIETEVTSPNLDPSP